jgi:hypothetical protein
MKTKTRRIIGYFLIYIGLAVSLGYEVTSNTLSSNVSLTTIFNYLGILLATSAIVVGSAWGLRK